VATAKQERQIRDLENKLDASKAAVAELTDDLAAASSAAAAAAASGAASGGGGKFGRPPPPPLRGPTELEARLGEELVELKAALAATESENARDSVIEREKERELVKLVKSHTITRPCTEAWDDVTAWA